MESSPENRWFHRYQSVPEPDIRLIAFPHAGGSASYFFPLATALRQAAHPLRLDVMATQYPGRQDRRLEPCIQHLSTLADLVCRELLPFADRPLLLFGHSMGALVAFEVARRLERVHGIVPLTLFVSGRPAPSLSRREHLHQLPDSGIINELGLLNGTDSLLLADAELLGMILPAIRADYKAVETHLHQPGPRLRCGIHTVLGDADPRVTVDEARGWAEHTSGNFQLSVFKGGHFYLKEEQDALVTTIVDRLSEFSTERIHHG